MFIIDIFKLTLKKLNLNLSEEIINNVISLTMRNII